MPGERAESLEAASRPGANHESESCFEGLTESGPEHRGAPRRVA